MIKQEFAVNGILLFVAVFLGLGAMGCEPARTVPPPIVKSVVTVYEPLPVAVQPRVDYPAESQGQWPMGWLPSSSVENKRRWRGITLHHSASESGNAAHFNEIHKKNNGWDGLGYHFVIDNGRGGRDGAVEVGYRWKDQSTGAHCRPKNCTDNYWNEHTIGICLVGNFETSWPSRAQMNALTKLVRFLQQRYRIPTSEIRGHGQVPGTHTACPGKNLSVWQFKQRL